MLEFNDSWSANSADCYIVPLYLPCSNALLGDQAMAVILSY